MAAAANVPDTIDWSPTTAQKIGGAVGVAIGASTLAADISPATAAAFLVAYPTACFVIPRLRGIVAHERTTAFLAHEAAMAAIAVGWAVEREWASAAFNGAWMASAAAWWLSARRR